MQKALKLDRLLVHADTNNKFQESGEEAFGEYSAEVATWIPAYILAITEMLQARIPSSNGSPMFMLEDVVGSPLDKEGCFSPKEVKPKGQRISSAQP
jgi:hypothetical protein